MYYFIHILKNLKGHVNWFMLWNILLAVSYTIHLLVHLFRVILPSQLRCYQFICSFHIVVRSNVIKAKVEYIAG